jgi:hypothetical protein
VFWCEPPEGIADGRSATVRRLTAEATLAKDWQPESDWTWTIPSTSNVRRLTINVDEHGQWGELTCDAGIRQLSLVRGRLGSGNAFTKATLRAATNSRSGNDAAPSQPISQWVRYSETDLYPAWIWFCSKPPATEQTLDVETQTGSGKLTTRGRFTASSGLPCLIDPTTKAVVGRAHVENERRRQSVSAAPTLLLWPQPKCDPTRSYLARNGSAGS